MASGSNTFGGTIKLDGEAEYRKAIKAINTDLREMGSTLKLAAEQYKNNDATLKSTKSTYKDVNTQVQDQKEKIKELRTALKEAEQKYGENSTQVKTWKTQLNNAETQLYSLEKQTNASTKEIKDMKNSEDSAGQSAIKLGDLIKANIISDAIIGGIKTLGSAMKAVGSSMLDVGKSAVQSYADYEQLAGGVETLFKDSSETVKNYANEAYKTTGLSANEYMETVTSFSASLLQSLGGDTGKAADVANMTLIDMADNANKMGTSMDSIQNAYQGFAKQNYTMLDNLKLGYGGTKSEMQRLLADAQKITGVKYDITNLNDVYSAIHVIQGELGITGTTALEASTTIEGSMSAMQSSWQNLLTGMATGNSDISGLVTNVVDSAMTVLNNVIPVIETIAKQMPQIIQMIVQKLVAMLPQLLQTGMQLLQNILDGFMSVLPTLLPAVIQLITTLVTFIVQNLPTIIEAGIQILLSLIEGLTQSLPTLIPTIVDAVILIVDTLIDNIDMIIDAAIEIIFALADGLIAALPKLIEKVPVIIDKLVNKLTNPEMLGKLIYSAGVLIGKLAEGLIKAIPQLLSKIPQILSSITSALGNGWQALKEAGGNLLKGLWEGMSGLKDWLWNKVKSMLNGLTDKIKNFFGIHSPSTLFRDQIGNNLALGIGEGFTDEMYNVNKDIQDSLPRDFDLGINANLKSSISKEDTEAALETSTISFTASLKEALRDVKIILDDEEVGNFVTKTVEEVVYV